ncbi:hypothetical protein [Bacillus sp. FJAT-28004]|uniref:hypothetical protein n=1 Tax=Bacillus sp. FJAT-28004 TaxID=1679165 RepID=UPI0006B53E63|nr:hypothetical protein [Bacillus sp. FJAT-28004]
MRIVIDNLGIPPLAGICNYEDACKPGYSVDFNVNLLKRYYFVKSRMNKIYAAHLARTPEWEVKCAFSLHLYLEAEHAASLRKRVSEMREPPLNMDKVTDPALEQLMDELIRAADTRELLSGIHAVIKPEMIRSLEKHLAETNPLIDYPTCRILLAILHEEKQMQAWGEKALAALTQDGNDADMLAEWRGRLEWLQTQAGGIFGDMPTSEAACPFDRRSDGTPYAIDPMPQRDTRFIDPYNKSAEIDSYYRDESLSIDERTYALLYKRLREMDVPEWMGPILYTAKGKPCEYYVDMSRQLWDEARHAMMGEVGLNAHGVHFYKYPIDMNSSVSLNMELEPIEAHLILWAIEQGLMNKNTGKGWEFEIAQRSDHELAALFQDYDWADEVLHTQIGRKWLVPEIGSMEVLKTQVDPLWKKWADATSKRASLSGHEQWWDRFIADIRKQQKINKTEGTNHARAT